MSWYGSPHARQAMVVDDDKILRVELCEFGLEVPPELQLVAARRETYAFNVAGWTTHVLGEHLAYQFALVCVVSPGIWVALRRRWHLVVLWIVDYVDPDAPIGDDFVFADSIVALDGLRISNRSIERDNIQACRTVVQLDEDLLRHVDELKCEAGT